MAALDADDADHERCLRLLETAKAPLLVPGPVLTEVCWLLERERGTAAEAAFLEAIARGELSEVAPGATFPVNRDEAARRNGVASLPRRRPVRAVRHAR